MLGHKDSSPVAGQDASDRSNRPKSTESAVHPGRTWARHVTSAPFPHRGTGTLSQAVCSPEVA